MNAQAPIFAYLADPASHGGAPVTRIDTHAAVVFLAGPRAFKVKRSVRFPFLDYSTLEKRRAACEQEIEVNRAFASDIYRGVVAITRAGDGALAIGGHGEPVEYAVEMRRFDESQTLDHLAIGTGLAEALGRMVAAAHATAPVAEAAAWIETLGAIVNQNAEAFAERPDLFPVDAGGALDRQSRAAYARARPLITERGRVGLVRRGHGDLHLGNIVLIDGHPVMFDAIEFDPRIATGDLFYDLAFLLMDLIERGNSAAAAIVLNRYLVETGRDSDLDALAMLPLFLSVRAAIRAKVTAARQDAATPAERDAIGTEARGYFDLACRLIDPPAPVLVAVGGLSGTGKSVLARTLAPGLPPAPGAVVLRSDVERKAHFGVAENDRLPAEAYRPEVTATVYARLAAKAKRVVAAGHSAIADAVFARETERAALATAAREAGVPFRGLFLTADLATRIARVGARAHDASDADAGVARRQEAYDLGRIDWIEIDASATPQETLARAKAAL